MSVLRPPASSWFPVPGFSFGFLRRAPRTAPPAKPREAPARQSSVDFDRILAGIRAAPQLEMIEWAGDGAIRSSPPAPACDAAADAEAFDAASLDARRRKLRDRYIAARFPGVAKCGADLVDEDTVIRAARLMFEDERSADALELLELAVEENPANTAAWLARLEILFLVRDAGEFTQAARAFRMRSPRDGEAWTEICRLGRALVPHEPLFEGTVAVRDHEHYGPWPHTPNWIRAPWDLTAEVAAADLHRAFTRKP